MGAVMFLVMLSFYVGLFLGLLFQCHIGWLDNSTFCYQSIVQ